MGLASYFLGEQNPVSQWVGSNRNMLLGASAGFLQGRPGSGVLEGKMVDDAYATAEKEKAARAEQIKQAAAAARNAGHEQLAQLLESGMGAKDPIGDATSLYKTMNPQTAQGPESFFGNIVPMQDENGNIVLGQASNQGNWQPLQGAEGMRPAPTTRTVNTETHQIIQDIYGNELYRIPIGNREAARDTAIGAAEGGAQGDVIAAAGSLRSKLPGLRKVVEELNELGKKATYTMPGVAWDEAVKQIGLEPSEAAVARAKYTAMVDNQILPLLVDTFGAQFTVAEGQALRATLGDPNKSPQEKQAVLEAFIAQKLRDLEAMDSRMGEGGAVDPLGIR